MAFTNLNWIPTEHFCVGVGEGTKAKEKPCTAFQNQRPRSLCSWSDWYWPRGSLGPLWGQGTGNREDRDMEEKERQGGDGERN